MAEISKISLDNIKTQYDFNASPIKKKIMMFFIIGLALLVIGIILHATGIMDSAGHHDAGHATEHTDGHGGGHDAGHGGGEHTYHWTQRLIANVWLCAVYFNGIALIGVFFVAVNYLGYAGWPTLIKRVPEAFGYFLPIIAVVIILTFFIGGHNLFHWTDASLYEGPHRDEIAYGKSGYFFAPFAAGSFPFFFVLRMFLYFALWFGLFLYLRKLSVSEDRKVEDMQAYLKKPSYHNKLIYFSAVFITVFAVTSSTAAWDWVMSIDVHWFSTMFGWYNFASWFVGGLATITLAIIFLKEQGYFNEDTGGKELINNHHLHDLGKFMFAFSIFWTYIWFAQFLLYYYANLGEEVVYFWERLSGHGGNYFFLFFFNLFINFAFPFLALMTRASKRTTTILKIVAFAIVIGHWLDFYMMIMPTAVGEHGGFGPMEIGMVTIFASAFAYVVGHFLSKESLIAKNHPMLQESIHHEVV